MASEKPSLPSVTQILWSFAFVHAPAVVGNPVGAVVGGVGAGGGVGVAGASDEDVPFATV